MHIWASLSLISQPGSHCLDFSPLSSLDQHDQLEWVLHSQTGFSSKLQLSDKIYAAHLKLNFRETTGFFFFSVMSQILFLIYLKFNFNWVSCIYIYFSKSVNLSPNLISAINSHTPFNIWGSQFLHGWKEGVKVAGRKERRRGSVLISQYLALC